MLNSHPRFLFIHHADDQPAHRTSLVTHRLARCRTVRRNHHLLMHAGTVRINRDLRRALRLTVRADGLTYHEPPAIEARMFPSRHDVAFDAC